MRYFHPGADYKYKNEKGEEVSYGFMTVGNHPLDETKVVVPPLFGGGSQPLKPNAVCISAVGWGFHQVAEGEYVDIDETRVPVKSVKLMAPQLLTKDEAVKAGICYGDGSPKRNDDEELPKRKYTKKDQSTPQ